MPRISCPLQAADISSFAKSLAKQLAESHGANARLPGHVELLNMLARAAGHRNFQSLRAKPAVAPSAPTPGDSGTPAPLLTATAAKALRQFDDQGRVLRWPTKYSVQRLMLWGLWMRFQSRRHYSEREVNEVLNAWHLFGDHCTLRRELINMKLLRREPDGSKYQKVAVRADAEVTALLHALRSRNAKPSRRALMN